MTEDRLRAYNASVERINALSDAELDALIAQDACPYEPEHLLEVPMGMHHCPLCLEMVVAGCPHPRQSVLREDPPETMP